MWQSAPSCSHPTRFPTLPLPHPCPCPCPVSQIVRKDQQGQNKAARSGAAAEGGGRRRDPLEDLRREVAVMRRAAHPNVVALREVRLSPYCVLLPGRWLACLDQRPAELADRSAQPCRPACLPHGL